ncbi:MAG: sulfatase/phosphatase domain-containing protein, partial [Bacteroidota bacterium]
GREAAGLHEMGIYEHLDLVYDNKMLGEGPEFETRLSKFYVNLYGRMDDTQKKIWDAHYVPILEEFKTSKWAGEDLAQWKYNRYMRDYLGTIQSVDDGVGQVLDYLKRNGLEENTLVVYTSDQGFYLGEHGWFDKRFMYEESFRTPILMRFPKKIKAGTVVDQMVQNLDFAPTFLDLAQVPIPKDMQGESLVPLMGGEAPKDWRDAIYYTYYEYPSEHNVNRHYGVRTDRYKLIHFYYEVDQWELYDLEKDPQEMHNVYGNPEYGDIQEQMHKKLEEVRLKYKDSDANNKSFLDEYLQARKDG